MAKGTSDREVLDGIREELAWHYLDNSSLPRSTQIGQAVGRESFTPERSGGEFTKLLAVVPGELSHVPEAPRIGNVGYARFGCTGRQFASNIRKAQCINVCLRADSESLLESALEGAPRSTRCNTDVPNRCQVALVRFDVITGIC